MSSFEALAGVHRDPGDVHDEDARQQQLQVLAWRAGQRAAEQVRVQQREHDRERRHVEQLHRDVLDLEHRPPAERQRRRQRATVGDGRRAVASALAQRVLGDDGVGDGDASCRVLLVSSVGRRRDGRSGRGTPRRGWAGRGRTRRRRCRRVARAAEGRGGRGRRRRRRPTGRPGPTRAATSAAERLRRAPAGRRRAGPTSRTRTCSEPAPTDALSSPRVPSAMTRPWSMMARRSASWSASSRYCVVSSTVAPSPTSTRTMSQTWLRLRGSRPVVGSSRNSRSGVTTMLAAMSSRRRMPPE